MALSRYEQEALDQIELGLRPGGLTVPVRRLTTTRSGRSRRRMLVAVATIAVGLALVLAGLVSKAIFVSVLGFPVIVAASMAMGSLAGLFAGRPPS